jgi:hypothetical protein
MDALTKRRMMSGCSASNFVVVTDPAQFQTHRRHHHLWPPALHGLVDVRSAAPHRQTLRWFTGSRAHADYHAFYHATDAQRSAFLDRVERAMRKL